MIRAVKLLSVPLNTGKLQTLRDMVDRYAAQKNDFIRYLAPDLANMRLGDMKGERQYRDQLTSAKFVSPHGITTQLWRMALTDAWQSMDRWLLGAVSAIYPPSEWSDAQKHYFNWLKCDSRRIARLLGRRAEKNPKIFLGQRNVGLSAATCCGRSREHWDAALR